MFKESQFIIALTLYSIIIIHFSHPNTFLYGLHHAKHPTGAKVDSPSGSRSVSWWSAATAPRPPRPCAAWPGDRPNRGRPSPGRPRDKGQKMWGKGWENVGKKHLWKSFKVSKPIFRGFHGSFQVRNWKPMTNTVSDGSSKMCWHGINQHTNLLNEDAERNPSTKMGGTKIPPATRSSLMAAAPEPLISLATFIFIQPVLGLRVFRITSYIVGVKLISKTSPNHDFRKLHAKLMRGARVHMSAHSVNMPRLSTVIDHRGPTRLGTATALHTPSMGNKCPTGIMPGIGIHI